MLASNGWIVETAKDIIYEFEELLSKNDIKIDNKNPNENIFETEDSCINKKDYDELKIKIIKQLKELADYVEYEAA